ncbi:MAG: O-antigen ligase family protein [Balneolales bacterium]|nr:O-antigen ligase family protein [Balneolales bacterium]
MAISAVALGLALWLQVSLLPLLLLLIPAGIYAYWQTFHMPWLWFVAIVGGTYTGTLFLLAEGAIVVFSPFQLALFAALFSILIRRILERDIHIRLMGIELEFALFMGLIFLSLLWSPMHMEGFIRALRLLVSIVFIYLVFNELRKQKEIIYVLTAIAGIGALLAVMGLYQNLTNVEAAVLNVMGEGRLMRGRVSGTTYDPNIFATMFFIPIAFLACVSLSEIKLAYRLPALFTLAILGGGLIVTYSRSAWLSVIFMVLIIAWYYRNIKLFGYFVIAIVIVSAAFPQFTLALLNAAQRFLDITSGAGGDDSSRIRLLLGIAAINMFIDSYFIGVGFRGYIAHFTDYFSLQESIGVFEPHNVTYTVLAELGIIGIVIYGTLMFKIARTAYRSVKTAATEMEKILALTCFSTFLAYLIFYQFYGGGLSDNNFFFIIGLIYAVHYSRQKGQDDDTESNAALPANVQT